ncbi:MAG: AraC family transcriptional regulator [Chitinophagaceae bacterium]|nr:AraC family transcriptional regulator [Chitinophagaceae bacterium]MCW5914532.1 AraC family transcriptional regulator [Chitinophagaceae bacterium]MCZ2395364.1 helix-turn-helix domain-containing protein [Chitinophagales bacterium]
MTHSTAIYFPTSETEKYFIRSIWRLQEFYQHPQTEIILPKGTVELIFNLSDKITYLNPGADVRMALPNCFINGINFKPFQLIKNGQQIFLGIQLNTIGLRALFDVPVKEFNDAVAACSQVCKSLDGLYSQIFSEEKFEGQVEIIRKWLLHKISTSKYLSEIQKLHNWFYCHDCNTLTVKELHNKVCISDRQLRRLSTEWLGMNTETFLLYNKYLTSLYLLHHSNLPLTQIGLEAGYYDQSHFIREFKSFTGLTPKEYQLSAKGIPGHIFR